MAYVSNYQFFEEVENLLRRWSYDLLPEHIFELTTSYVVTKLGNVVPFYWLSVETRKLLRYKMVIRACKITLGTDAYTQSTNHISCCSTCGGGFRYCDCDTGPNIKEILVDGQKEAWPSKDWKKFVEVIQKKQIRL